MFVPQNLETWYALAPLSTDNQSSIGFSIPLFPPFPSASSFT
jgi:hypothetical protein